MKTIRVDFNSRRYDGDLWGLQDHASSRLHVGDMVLAREGNYTCLASVVAVESSGIVRLLPDLVSWQDEQIPA